MIYDYLQTQDLAELLAIYFFVSAPNELLFLNVLGCTCTIIVLNDPKDTVELFLHFYCLSSIGSPYFYSVKMSKGGVSLCCPRWSQTPGAPVPCVLTSQVAGTTGVPHYILPIHLIFRSCPYRQKICIDMIHLNLFYNTQNEYSIINAIIL